MEGQPAAEEELQPLVVEKSKEDLPAAESSQREEPDFLMVDEEDATTPDGSVNEATTRPLSEILYADPIPVGITIAYKHQQQGGNFIREKLSRPHEEAEQPPRTRKSTQLQVFIDSALIYSVCLILPSILGYAYQIHVLWNEDTPKPETMSNYYEWFVTHIYEPEVQFLCEESDDSSYLWTSVSSVSQYLGLCRPKVETFSIYSNDIFAWSDSFSITVFSIIIALLRIAIVHFTVPLDDSEELEAMVRCKSMHLLSSDYVVTPVGTPVRPRRMVQTTASTSSILLPNLNHNDAYGGSPVHLETIGKGIPKPKQGHHEDSKEDLLEFEEQLIQKLAAEAKDRSTRMYAGPRYATALFRLSYSASAVFIALLFFRTADFWPWYVFGHGDSSQCWDLSGGLAVAMDSDFDQRNVYLKQYFLWQASYHWHSAAFHILSMLILVVHPTKHAPRRFISLQKGTALYVRRLFQHALAVALIGIAYVFSSLRRLGAIGLFAFDVSSCCLHLLQLCINAPENSRLSRSSTIAGVFWILVVPTFVLARFAIWPAIWYSAIFESSAWLRQLEKTLWPGSAAMILYAIHGLMVALEVLSMVYFKRLFNHDHVKRILRLGKPDASRHGPTTPRQLFATDGS